MELFAQAIGFSGVVINLLIYQQKTQKRVLLFKFLSDMAWAVHYLLIGAFSGAAIACVGLLRESVFMLSEKHRKKWLVLFLCITAVSVYLTRKNWFSLFPAIASFLSVISFWQRNPNLTRFLAFPISLCMGTYSFSNGSWAGICNEVLTVSSATIGLLRKEINKKMTKKPFRVGAINWDCAVPEDTYFGFHSTKSLSPNQFRYRTPYYAHIEGENKIRYSYKTQEEFDRELEYAIEAGIDYFAYTWYTEEKPDRDDLEGKLHEITYGRNMHLKSALKDKIKLCAMFVCLHIHTDNDLEKLAAVMKESYYEKVNGRPLVYLFGGYRLDYIERLNVLCQKHSLPKPYIVFLNNGVESEDGNYSKADAVSAYTCGAEGITTYEQLCERLEQSNEARKKLGIDTIPLFTTGWDPTPRIVSPVPWVSYPDTEYAAFATEKELLDGAKRLCAWIKKNQKVTKSRHILTFAWNEFEEGGFICPTYNEDGTVNDERIKTFKKISEMFKKTL